MPGYCYMSCNNTDNNLAKVIIERLSSGQYDVISSGSTECNYQSRRTRILDCKVFIAIITPEFIKKDIHLYELSLALDLGRKILLLQHDLVQELPSPFPVLRFVRWHQDLSILANTVFQIIQEKNKGKSSWAVFAKSYVWNNFYLLLLKMVHCIIDIIFWLDSYIVHTTIKHSFIRFHHLSSLYPSVFTNLAIFFTRKNVSISTKLRIEY